MPVRPARPADLADLAALDALLFGAEAYPAVGFRQLHDLFPTLLLVAGDHGAVDGYTAAALGADRDGWILSLGVRPDARGRGLGAALTRAALDGLRSLGAPSARLTVAPDNAAAAALYARLGFVEVARDPAYFGPGRPRRVLRASLR